MSCHKASIPLHPNFMDIYIPIISIISIIDVASKQLFRANLGSTSRWHSINCITDTIAPSIQPPVTPMSSTTTNITTKFWRWVWTIVPKFDGGLGHLSQILPVGWDKCSFGVVTRAIQKPVCFAAGKNLIFFPKFGKISIF